MRWKSTLALLVITFGVAAYVSLYEIRQPSPERRAQLARQVLSLDPAAAARLSLRMPNGQVALTRIDGGWVVEPKRVRADAQRIEDLLDRLDPLWCAQTLAARPGQPLEEADYGLAPEAGELTVETPAGATTLRFGRPTALERQRYLQVNGREEIFVVDAALFDAANQAPEAFRDPSLVRFDRATLTGLTLAAAGTAWTLAKTDSGWALTQPLTDPADPLAINDLLSRLGALKIRRFVQDGPDEAAEWGFGAPKAALTLLRGEMAPSLKLTFGAVPADDATMVYARRSDEPAVYAVAGADLELVLKAPGALRAQACFPVSPEEMTKVEVRRGETAWTIEKREDRWYLPGEEAPLSPERVENLLKSLIALRVLSFFDDLPAEAIAAKGFESPVGSLTVWVQARPQPMKIVVASGVKDAETYYGRIAGRSAVVELPMSAGALLDTSPQGLAADPPEEP